MSNDVEVLSKKSDEIAEREHEAKHLLRRAETLEIRTDRDFAEADELFANIRERREAVEEFFEPMRQRAYDAWQSVLSRRDEVTGPLEEAEDRLKSEIARYKEQREQEAEEEKRDAIETAKQERQEEIEEKIREAEEAGDTEKARRLREHADEHDIEIDLPDLAPPEGEHTQTRTHYTAEVTDLKKLCEAIGKGEAPEKFVEPVKSALNAFARSTEGQVPIAGVTVKKKTIVAKKPD